MRNLLNQKFRVPQGTAMANVTEAAARYQDIIDLSLGDPDIPTPRGILDQTYIDTLAGHTKYTDPRGYRELREAIGEFYLTEYDDELADEEIFVTASGVVGMYLALQVLLDPGDEVIIPDPYFTCYPDQVRAAGGIPIFLPTREEDGFSINLERLSELVNERTRAIIINSPNNPTGACLSREALEGLAAFCIEHDLLVIADDIYTNFTYEEKFYPIRALPGMGERTVTINSFSKNFIMTGFRVGNLVAPAEVVRAVRQLNEYVMYSAPAMSQRAALWALRERRTLEPPIRKRFRERMEYAAKRINEIPWMSVPMPQGSIYLFPSIGQTGLTSAEVTKRILEKAHVLVLPGDAFGCCGEGYLRIACTVENQVMAEAMDRIFGMRME